MAVLCNPNHKKKVDVFVQMILLSSFDALWLFLCVGIAGWIEHVRKRDKICLYDVIMEFSTTQISV